jgi:hypothetical protein
MTPCLTLTTPVARLIAWTRTQFAIEGWQHSTTGAARGVCGPTRTREEVWAGDEAGLIAGGHGVSSQPLGLMALVDSVSWMTLHLEFDELARKR